MVASTDNAFKRLLLGGSGLALHQKMATQKNLFNYGFFLSVDYRSKALHCNQTRQ